MVTHAGKRRLHGVPAVIRTGPLTRHRLHERSRLILCAHPQRTLEPSRLLRPEASERDLELRKRLLD
eukprot:6994006-Prymnesium_polylepis.1